MKDRVRPVRAVVAAALGGLLGGVASAGVVGYVLLPLLPGDRSGLAELGVVLFTFDAGVVVGGAAALAFAFRDEPARRRLVTIATVALSAALVGLGTWQEWIDPGLLFPPLVLAVTPVLALLGRLVGALSGWTVAE